MHVSLRYNKLLWQAGERFTGWVFTHDDLGVGIDHVDVSAWDADGKPLSISRDGNAVSFPVPAGSSFTVECTVTAGGETRKNTYLFLTADDRGKAEKQPVLRMFDRWRK